ncbi:MAG TPA: hypothetical protein VGK67_22960 [Myxococcales bacterium]|jgi:hypothetical protein
MSELSPEARALLEAARQDGAPTEADRARVERALLQAIGATPAATAPKGSTRLPRPQASGSVASAAVKALLVAALAASVAVAVVVFSAPRPKPAAPESRAPMTRAPLAAPGPSVLLPAPGAAPSVVLQEKQPALVPIPVSQTPRFRPVQQKAPVFAPLDLREPSPAVAAPAPAAPAAQASESQLAEELRLMSQAQQKLRDGDAAGALALLDEHVSSFPRGALSEERAAARVQALCALGRVPEARSESVEFLADHPRSPYAAKVRSACGVAP